MEISDIEYREIVARIIELERLAYESRQVILSLGGKL